MKNQRETYTPVPTSPSAEVRTELLKGFVCVPDELLNIGIITDIFIQDLQISKSCTWIIFFLIFEYTKNTFCDKRVNIIKGKR